VLVTGAAGITGHAAVKRLLSEGALVLAVTGKNRKLEVPSHENLVVVKADLMEYKVCEELTTGIDCVVNLVAYIRGAGGQTSSPVELVRNNLFPSVNMIEAAVKNKVKVFGFVGSSTMYPDVSYPVREEEAFDSKPCDVYRGVGWMKRYCEQLCMYMHDISDTKFAMARTTAIYGPHDAFNENGHVIPQLMLKAKRGDSPFEVWGDGSQIRDFIYVDDVVDGLLTIMEKAPNGIPYNVSTGTPTDVKTLAKTVTDAFGYQPEFNFDSSKPTMIKTRLVSVDKIKNDLGWVAKTDLKTGIEKTVKWLKENQ
jgi:GDP-L-fucose synthase